jgi:hypothetical protein
MLLGTTETDNRTTEQEDRKGKGKAKEVDEEDKQPATAGGAPLAVSRLCDVGARNWWQWTPLHFAGALSPLLVWAPTVLLLQLTRSSTIQYLALLSSLCRP